MPTSVGITLVSKPKKVSGGGAGYVMATDT